MPHAAVSPSPRIGLRLSRCASSLLEAALAVLVSGVPVCIIPWSMEGHDGKISREGGGREEEEGRGGQGEQREQGGKVYVVLLWYSATQACETATGSAVARALHPESHHRVQPACHAPALRALRAFFS